MLVSTLLSKEELDNSLVSIYLERITEALATDYVLRIRSQFLAEAGDVNINGPFCYNYISPNTVHKFLA